MLIASRVLATLAVLLTISVSAAGAQLRDATLATRALTDADMEKLVAITRELAVARKDIPAISSPEGIAQLRTATVKATEKQGWGSLDFAVVDQRVKVALQHIKMEASSPVPAEKKAEVDLVRKWKQRLEEAKAAKTSASGGE
jgi:hypothetical protein